MWQHTIEEHKSARDSEDGMLDYKPAIHGVYLDVMKRTIGEGVNIKNKILEKGTKCLNSKNEYFKPQFTMMDYKRLLQ